ncbi:efflux transporter outer membrane subunit [Klebsiella pneumoniae]|uniref:efflux transporter outer membrane subunit n=1 Tax=Klebsiella pneumoniae TaxID=573 RepID=UPI00133073B0|nr:efflux transporter outer membrane subunit [Klebsiella pneumoniae]
MFRLSFMFIALLTAGCVSLDPHYDRPAAPVPATLPGAHGESTAVVGDWQKVVNDARLKKVVSIALNSNRDVQKALADIEAARAQYGETRASLFPTVDAELSHTRSKTVASGLSSASQADGAVSSFELDLFGKNQSLSRAARETWLASEFTAQNTRLTMIADLTTAWVTLATDNSNLALAQQTMDSAANSRNIVASYRTLVAQDKNAINLLAGETVPESLLPGTLESLGDNSIALVPAGVSSSVLLRRPDIQEAEHNLKSANADIGAARANFFPSISLTASAGVGSDSLSSLFSHGMQVWSFAPSISLPLFTGGSNLSQLRYAEAEKKGLIATYEKSIQSAFKDVADALARRETLSEELDAQRQYVAAEQTSLDIAMKSYQAGVGDYLSVLTAQRTLWSAKTTLLSLQQTDLNNRITLWQSLGGGAS